MDVYANALTEEAIKENLLMHLLIRNIPAFLR